MLTAEPAQSAVEGSSRPTSRPRTTSARLAIAYGPAALLVAAAIGIWELLCRALDVPDYLWPAPSAVVMAFGDEGGAIAHHTWVTAREVIAGFAIALAAGLAIGIVLHVSRTLRRAVYPILIASQSVPTIVLAPVLVLVLGYGIGPKLAVIGLFCFFPIVVNTVDGLGAVDREYVRMMLTLDASRRSIFRRVEFPSALPAMFTGTRIAATYAAIGAVFGEWAGSGAGLGYEMLQAQGRLDTPRVFVAVVVVTAIALLLFALVSLVERVAVPWARRDEGAAP